MQIKNTFALIYWIFFVGAENQANICLLKQPHDKVNIEK